MKKAKTIKNNLLKKLRKEEKHLPISFDNFLIKAQENPERIFRNIFQLTSDMVNYFVPQVIDESSKDPEDIGFVKYDFSKLFLEGVDKRFFPDMLFGNRFMDFARRIRKNSTNNSIYLFEGPAGSGKSTFLNNFVAKLEEYTRHPEGVMYETFWRLDVEKMGGFPQLPLLNPNPKENPSKKMFSPPKNMKFLDVPCPHHDHPILQVSKEHRRKFLDELISDEKFKKTLFHNKEYKWIFDKEPCTICTSLHQKLSERDIDPKEIFEMMQARRYKFNRRLGEGVSIFNPADSVDKRPIQNPFLQQMLNTLLKDSHAVSYLSSNLARTNNGVYAIMDVMGQNQQRLKDLHGIVSDSVQKVANLEETISSLFIGLINPEDKKIYQNTPSFRDRIVEIKIPYILDFKTEVQMYQSELGSKVKDRFLPGVLENFAKIVISSRLSEKSETIDSWVQDPKKYIHFVDPGMLLLKMEMYTGEIPAWITENDRNEFDKDVRRELIGESNSEGFKGVSGRQSIKALEAFMTKYSSKETFTMQMVEDFFYDSREEFDVESDKLKLESKEDGPSNPFMSIPEDFLVSVIGFYDFNVLQQVKDSIYQYNQEEISRLIQGYLFSINHGTGEEKVCPFTGEKLNITGKYFKGIEGVLLEEGDGEGNGNMKARMKFRHKMKKMYTTQTLAQEMRVQDKDITETQQYQDLFRVYANNIKDRALVPYLENNDFKDALKEYETKEFERHEEKMKRDVTFLLKNLQEKHGYTLQGAKDICFYTLDRELAVVF